MRVNMVRFSLRYTDIARTNRPCYAMTQWAMLLLSAWPSCAGAQRERHLHPSMVTIIYPNSTNI